MKFGMKMLMLWAVVLSSLCGSSLSAQNLTGTWQGTLKAGTQEVRMAVKISLEDDKPKAAMYLVDQGQQLPSPVITQNGSTVKIAVAAINAGYEGKVSADGNSITGTFTQGQAFPLNLTRATPETAWTIAEPPPPLKQMPADAKPAFEVATIKPSKPEEPSSLLVNRSGILNATNMPLADLIKFAYDVNARQIIGAPSWMESEKFNITAQPDTSGQPSMNQLKMMLQGLLADRFELKFHRDKKEMSVYAITIGKGGVKMTRDENNPNGLPFMGGGGPRGMVIRNATMADFASLLQGGLLEQPVVDQTGLGAARYDFILKFTPDAAQMARAGGAQPNAAANDPDAPPDLFSAVEQQLGLKLQSTKAPADVMVIDHVEQPSAN